MSQLSYLAMICKLPIWLSSNKENHSLGNVWQFLLLGFRWNVFINVYSLNPPWTCIISSTTKNLSTSTEHNCTFSFYMNYDAHYDTGISLTSRLLGLLLKLKIKSSFSKHKVTVDT